MVLERQVAEGGPRSHSIRAVAPQLGVGEETLRMWCNRHAHEITQAPAGEDLQQENKRLKRELAEANDSMTLKPISRCSTPVTRPEPH